MTEFICEAFKNWFSNRIWHTCMSPQGPRTRRNWMARPYYQDEQDYELRQPQWPPPKLHLERERERESIENESNSVSAFLWQMFEVVWKPYVFAVSTVLPFRPVFWPFRSLSFLWDGHVPSLILLTRFFKNCSESEETEEVKAWGQMCFFSYGSLTLQGNSIKMSTLPQFLLKVLTILTA